MNQFKVRNLKKKTGRKCIGSKDCKSDQHRSLVNEKESERKCVDREIGDLVETT